MGYQFHILGVPHTISVPEYSGCAFTQKIVKLCKMLKARGHTVFHYGHEDSSVHCDEHVTVTTRDDLHKSYGDHDWRKNSFPNYRNDDHVYTTFNAKTIAALEQRKRPGDFLLCTFGGNHKPIADAHPDMIVCEPGIGYPDGGFAKFRIFESYAVMHAYHGERSIKWSRNDTWYDVVIPNYFDLEDFEFSADKDDYFLFLGRVNDAKGVHIALQIVEEVGGRLIIAGSGALSAKPTRTDRPIFEYAELVGLVGPSERKRLMARAKATITPSHFLEPFCGVQIESMLSGTPVISSDWGAFAEYNIHGVTGYRCRTFEHFTWAARNIHTLDPNVCRAWAERNFSLERVADLYDEYFFSVHNVFSGQGWYQKNDRRPDLDWLRKHYPTEPAPKPSAAISAEVTLTKSETSGSNYQPGDLAASEAFKEAWTDYTGGNLVKAGSLCREILTADPDNFDALQLLGSIQLKSNDLLGALATFDKALALRPNNVAVLNNRGNVLVALNQRALAVRGSGNASAPKHLEEALTRYDQALAAQPDDVAALNNRGSVLAALNRLDEALASFTKALMIKPDFVEALCNRGNAFRTLKRLNDALASYDQALAIRPDIPEALMIRGVTLRELKRFDEALASYDRALAARPDYAEALNNRGATLHELNRFDEALATYDRALAARPAYPEALNNRGITLSQLKRFNEALASFDRAIAARPAYAEALNNRGIALSELKRFDEALTSYDRALAVWPGYAEALNNRGITLSELKRFDEALTSYDRALVLRPGYAEALNNRGTTLQRLTRFDEALASYDRALAQWPTYAEALSNRAETVQELARFNEAACPAHQEKKKTSFENSWDIRVDRLCTETRPYLVMLRTGSQPCRIKPGRTFDLALSYYAPPHSIEAGDIVFTGGQSKLHAAKLFFDATGYHERYKGVLFLDEDVEPLFDLDEFFQFCEHHQLALAQASLTNDSCSGWQITRHCPSFIMRTTNFVEGMAPFFNREFLKAMLHSFEISISEWGLEFYWGHHLANKWRAAIIDQFQMRHPFKTGPSKYYEHLDRIGIDRRKEVENIFAATGQDGYTVRPYEFVYRQEQFCFT